MPPDNIIVEELTKFLKNLKLSNYEINAYITLLNSKNLTAPEITRRSNVPRGRVYNVLESLKEKGMVEIKDSRPKTYKSFPPNLAFNNLLSHIEEQNQNKMMGLYSEAKHIESKLHDSNFLIKQESSRVFWSTAYGFRSIESLYLRRINELEDELLLTGFLNKNTIKILPLAKKAHEGILNALNRGVKVYYLWSLEDNSNNLIEKQELEKITLYNDLILNFKKIYNLSTEIDGFELKVTYTKIPPYYDIFDKKTIVFKLLNPLNPWQIFACMNVLDPNLAENIRKKFFDLWLFDASD